MLRSTMQQEPCQLEYRAEPTHRRRGRLGCGLGLVAVTLVLVGLRELETMPYRPPYDMSTFLGGPELAFVRGMEVVFAAIGCALLVGFVFTFRPRRT
jgi:hypothetical protein